MSSGNGRRPEALWKVMEGLGLDAPPVGRPGCYHARVMASGYGADPRRALGREALAHADALYNLARYLTGNASDADDLVQETYAHALRAAGRFEPGSNLKAWLFCILRNTWRSLRRRQSRNPIVGGLDTVNPSPEVTADEGWLRGDMELDRLRKLVGEEIEQALMALSEEARTVILLDLEGLTERDVAAVLGCPVGTVKSRLSRARAALRQRLRDYGP
jgi:RNA polymerase sigma-70 factor, ECF subfamily